MGYWYRLELCLTEQAEQQGLYDEYRDARDLPKTNAGIDLRCASDFTVSSQSTSLMPLGCSARLVVINKSDRYAGCRCDEGPVPEPCDTCDVGSDSHFWLLPRSSIFKTGIRMSNSVGVIDSSYRGELKAPVIAESGSMGPVMTRIDKGTRLFQIVAPDMGWIREVRIVDALPETSRGSGGFGSTGSK